MRRPFEGVASPARVNLGLAGVSLPTRALLEFQADQAEARDAISAELAIVSLVRELGALQSMEAGLVWMARETLVLRSAANGRQEFLRRPELGRRLADPALVPEVSCDLAIVLADGLSALAVNRHALPLLQELLHLLPGWRIGPVSLVQQGRVAAGDAVGERMGADMVLVLIGERPGLTAPDSLGAYLTWGPRTNRTDAERECVSNIRPEGLGYDVAAERIAEALRRGRRRQLTGVGVGSQPALGSANVEGSGKLCSSAGAGHHEPD